MRTRPRGGFCISVVRPDRSHPERAPHARVGERLALLALRHAYGRAVVASGPSYRSHRTRADGQVEIDFSDLGGGLAARDGAGVLTGFAVAGVDRRFVPAQARVHGEHVIVWSDAVPQPQAVRYGWVDNPQQSNLVNRTGLPAAPFRTDRWPLLTEGVRFSP